MHVAALPAAPASSGDQGDIMIVCHGKGRGRPTAFAGQLIAALRDILGGEARCVRIHETGTERPSLRQVKVILFMLSDPLVLAPQCEREALAIAAEARTRGIRMINPPDALNNTIKSRQARMWKEADIPCASGISALTPDDLTALLAASRFPIILRYDPGHIQVGMSFCGTIEEALAKQSMLRYPAAILEFIDTRESWRRAKPDSVFARYFHKRRAMVFPDRVFNNHIFFSDDPIVGSASSTFKAAEQGQEVPRLDEMVAADIAYSLGPPEQPALMQAAVRALGLDVAAIDYSTFADGRVVLWEANPFFALPVVSKALLGAPRRLARRNPRYAAALARYLSECAGGTHE